MAKHIWTIASILCAQVLEEKDGSLSAIRIADRLLVDRPDSSLLINQAIPVASIQGLFVMRGDESGDHTFQVKIISPTGKELQEGEKLQIRLEGPSKGMNLNSRLLLEIREEGLYWIDVYLNDEVSVRVPLEVVFQSPRLG